MGLSISTKVLQNVGIEIKGLNFANEISSNCLKILYDYYNQFHLLVIRNQKLTEQELINVSYNFGEPSKALVPTYRLEKYPLITKHSNSKDENKKPMGVVAPEYVFHSDSYFTDNPSKATLFYSLKAPIVGGETHFVNMCLVYESLDESTKALIKEKKVKYKNAYINQPPVVHPLVRIHPVTKRKALFVNIHRALGIDGFDQKEALDLVEKLYNYAIRPEFLYKHQWNDGDLLVWHNPTTMHCATSIDDSQERLLYRILTKGDLPVS